MRAGGVANQPEDLRVTTIRQHPHLLPIVAEWVWREWWQRKGRTLEQMQAAFAECVAETGAPQMFVLLEGELPVGTVTLAPSDLDERPDLTPWLAAVFIIPSRRGRGYVSYLLTEFETACRTASIHTVWLYTNTAEKVYLRAGWKVVEVINRHEKAPVTLMRRTISGHP